VPPCARIASPYTRVVNGFMAPLLPILVKTGACQYCCLSISATRAKHRGMYQTRPTTHPSKDSYAVIPHCRATISPQLSNAASSVATSTTTDGRPRAESEAASSGFVRTSGCQYCGSRGCRSCSRRLARPEGAGVEVGGKRRMRDKRVHCGTRRSRLGFLRLSGS